MKRGGLFILCCLILVANIVRMVAAQGEGSDESGPATVQLAQWATGAQASSEYTDTRWSAMRATGEPDVLSCQDNVNAWASLEVTNDEILVLLFERAVRPTQVNIYQNYNPGAITQIEMIPAEGDYTIPIANSADPGTACPGVFSVNLPDGLPEANGVIIHLNQTLVGDWNEIDAVELVGRTIGEGPGDWVISSLESGAFPQYAVTSNDGSGGTSGTQRTDNLPSNTSAQNYGGEWGRAYNCDTGWSFDNGIELTVIQQRGGSQYRVTAVGMNGFDPALVVEDDRGSALCNDDDRTAAAYSANLPTGQAGGSSTSSQIVFNNLAQPFADISIITGGYNGQGGEFFLIIEGMTSSSADGAGDPFSLYVSPALLESGITPTAYMISVTARFDPLLYLIDSDYNPVHDTNNVAIRCDDAGNGSLCWGESFNLSRSYVSRSQNRQLPGGPLDAMLRIPLVGEWGYYLNYTMTGYNSWGDYVAVFHLGTAQKP